MRKGLAFAASFAIGLRGVTTFADDSVIDHNRLVLTNENRQLRQLKCSAPIVAQLAKGAHR